MKPEDLIGPEETLGEWEIHAVSYRLGERYHCSIDNVDPGARIAQGEGNSREAAERSAREDAARRLARTRRFPL